MFSIVKIVMETASFQRSVIYILYIFIYISITVQEILEVFYKLIME